MVAAKLSIVAALVGGIVYSQAQEQEPVDLPAGEDPVVVEMVEDAPSAGEQPVEAVRRQGLLGALAANQHEDGSFGAGDDRLLASTLAALVWEGSGYDHKVPSKYGRQLARLIAWLQAQPRIAAGLIDDDLAVHALFSLALIEGQLMSDDASMQERNQVLLTALLREQDAQGWFPARAGGDEVDLRASCYALLLCKSTSLGDFELAGAIGRWRGGLEARLDGLADLEDPGEVASLLAAAGRHGYGEDARVRAAVRGWLADVPALIQRCDEEELYLWSLAVFMSVDADDDTFLSTVHRRNAALLERAFPSGRPLSAPTVDQLWQAMALLVAQRHLYVR